jgi:acetyl/propionyl-CoA carboxylase alpha subunit
MNEKPLDYVQIDSRIRKHPKIRAFAASIGEVKHGHNYFINLLCEVGVYHPTGKITPADSAYVAELCLWDGDAEKLMTALVKAGLIHLDRRFSNHVVEIPGWNKRSGIAIKKREYCRQRRAGKKKGRDLERLGWSDESISESREEYANRSRRVRESDNRDRDRDIIYKGGKKKKEGLKLSDEERAQALQVYSHWQQYHPHATHQPDDTTLSCVVRNLRLERSVDQLTRCVDGYHHDKFYKGNVDCLKLSWMFLTDERVVGGLELRDKQKPASRNRLSKEEAAERKAIVDLLCEYGTRIHDGDVDLVMSKSRDQKKIRELLRVLPMEQRQGHIIAGVLDDLS